MNAGTIRRFATTALMTVSLATMCAALHAETIGSVDTTFRMVGANDSIEIEAFDDPASRPSTTRRSRA